MTADELVQYLSWAMYTLIFVLVSARAIRRPLRANIDIALFFTVVTIIIAITVLLALKYLQRTSLLSAITLTLLFFLGYLLLRLTDDFSEVPRWLMRSAEVSLALLVVGTFVTLIPGLREALWVILLGLAYLVALLLYTVVAFVRESRRSSGVTYRRMRAVAAGSLFLCLTFFVLIVSIFVPSLQGLWTALSHLTSLASGISYFLGFAPPSVLRRAWQEPELRAFLGRAARLPRLPTTAAIVEEMEEGVRASVGAPHARIALWDETAQVLHFNLDNGPIDLLPSEASISGRSFLTQRSLFTDNIRRDSPAMVKAAEASGTKALLVAPITAGDKRLGVLVAYAPRTPIFADEDLDLLQLLADQAAVILESRALIDEAARVQAREEVTRLKEDFLSAAAHDLKTPLTTIIAQTQLLERRAMRDPDAPTDIASVRKLLKEIERLKTLVLELLDAARAEQGKLVGERAEVDLTAAAQETCARHDSERHPCIVEAEGPIVGIYDSNRILQLFENLVENAVKYSPEGGPVRVKLWREGGWNHITVTDAGIGIPADDLPNVFERFHRGTNVDDRQFAGMGLGLFICRGIAEQHGGRISVSSTPGGGTTFHIVLPSAIPVSPDTVRPVAGASTSGDGLVSPATKSIAKGRS
ncbi:MAG TPA: GAF domain-containing sensor histidine kinase [Chloroflexia bacterium]|nr:GAF domain-containing sensor histidine kinase [Chloroflexia bacterium]